MKGLKIFFAWLITVVAGSILLPLIPLAFSQGRIGSNESGEFFFLFMIISALISAAASAPTVIVLLIVNAVNLGKSKRLKLVNMAHICMAVLTIIIGSLWIYFEFEPRQYGFFAASGGVILSYIGVVIFYGIVAVIIWYFMFRKDYKEVSTSHFRNDSGILDEPDGSF